MKRILVGFIMDGKSGGIDRYLLNFLEAVQDQNVEMDFLTNEISEELRAYLETNHCDLYAIAGLKHPIKQFQQVCKILDKKHYDMVYLNVSTAIDCIAAFAAKKKPIPERVIHSHSSGNDCESAIQRFVYNGVHKICKLFFWRAGTRYYGCSEKAGRWLFPKKIVESDQFDVVYNAVDRNRFQYDETLRAEVRRELEIESDELVIGHIGNFCYVKNYPFLIDVFEQVHQRNHKSVLLLVGTGVEFNEVQELVRKKGLEDAVRFLGWRADTDRLYQAMDVFVLPSRFEGLPIVGVEAQSAGLPCILSDNITREAKITKQCEFLPLKAGAEYWAKVILKSQDLHNRAEFLTTAENYDLERQKEQLCSIVRE